MKVLVYLDREGDGIAPLGYQLLAAARALAGTGGEVEALLLAKAPGPLLEGLGAADAVWVLEGLEEDAYLPDLHLKALVAATGRSEADLVLTGYSCAGLDLAAAAAAACGLPLLAYCLEARVEEGRVTTRSPLYGGRFLADAAAPLPALLSIMPGAFDEAAGRREGRPATRSLGAAADLGPLRMRLRQTIEPADEGVDITQSEALVCVGRGIGDTDSIEEARELAELLGAEIAGSRPVIDAGWLPKARQVGKSGRTVKPKLYLCLGVSGAPEHLEGMREAGFIVAVNKDPEAPIFEVAQLGATCDLFDLMEALTEGLRARG